MLQSARDIRYGVVDEEVSQWVLSCGNCLSEHSKGFLSAGAGVWVAEGDCPVLQPLALKKD